MKTKVLLGLLFLSIGVFAQDFRGKAVYKTHRKIDFKLGDKQGGENSALQKQLKAQLMRQFQKTFTLNFTKNESTYKENEALSSPQQQMGGMQIQIMGNGGGNDVLYKNIKEKRYANKTEISGKRFLIKDDLPNYGWEMTGETKNIGKYTCYKATRKRTETRRTIAFGDGDKDGDKEEIITIETVAWYTPEIPVSNGPESFWGLPGLILEIQDGKQTIVCTEIVLNPKETIEIKEPSKGKKVSQKKFETIMEEHTKDMMERFKNRRRSNDGNSVHIEIQG